ncbi:unnamed protein product [Protopolystoma xenopodis]|uniref:Uncharacterized protein n=1 Tax=Protopolystoma xenopodis TaxID=117903 RepID=A0A3S4ZQH8_9PLAT|nr:unnamed protein product [Protopolystoma xenopodis]
MSTIDHSQLRAKSLQSHSIPSEHMHLQHLQQQQRQHHNHDSSHHLHERRQRRQQQESDPQPLEFCHPPHPVQDPVHTLARPNPSGKMPSQKRGTEIHYKDSIFVIAISAMVGHWLCKKDGTKLGIKLAEKM